jgi:hypothetical protein
MVLGITNPAKFTYMPKENSFPVFPAIMELKQHSSLAAIYNFSPIKKPFGLNRIEKKLFDSADLDLDSKTCRLLIIHPVADAFVNSSHPNSNYGSQNTIEIDGSPEIISYLRFNVTGVTEPVQSVHIRFKCANGSPFGGKIYTISDNNWDEGSITYNSRPAIDGIYLDFLGKVKVNDIVDFDLFPAIAENGIYSFAIGSTYDNGVHYFSREDFSNPPTLIIHIGASNIDQPTCNSLTPCFGLELDTITEKVSPYNLYRRLTHEREQRRMLHGDE